MRLVEILFWLAIVWVLYANVGYLLLLQLLVLFKRRPVARTDITPPVSLIIAACNEEATIAAKLENTLALDYPSGELQVIVASDASTDCTDEIVASFAGRGVVLNPVPDGQGKVYALNATLPLATGEILVISDADSAYAPDALCKLVRNFADPRVGAVTGEERRVPEAASGKGLGESLYVRLDNRIKHLEGELNSMVMVNGGFFAIRRELYPAIDRDLTHDATVPCHLFLRGYRTAYEPEAVSVEVYPLTAAEDFRRRLRTISRAFYSYLSVPRALNPFRTGLFAFQVLSHRFVRWFVWPFLVLALLSNLLLLPAGALYRLALGCQLAFYLLALIGLLLEVRWEKRLKLFYIPYYFTYIFTAAFIAVLMALSGRRIPSWQPTRRVG